jgi:hypothetical protein
MRAFGKGAAELLFKGDGLSVFFLESPASGPKTSKNSQNPAISPPPFERWAGSFQKWAPPFERWAGGFQRWAPPFERWAGGFQRWARTPGWWGTGPVVMPPASSRRLANQACPSGSPTAPRKIVVRIAQCSAGKPRPRSNKVPQGRKNRFRRPLRDFARFARRTQR